MDIKVKQSIDELIEVVKSTEEYKDYKRCLDSVLKNPSSKEKVERAKAIRTKIDYLPENELNNDIGDELENEYLELTEDTGVHNFMMTEISICSLIQSILSEFINGIDIDVNI